MTEAKYNNRAAQCAMCKYNTTYNVPLDACIFSDCLLLHSGVVAFWPADKLCNKFEEKDNGKGIPD